MKRIEHSHTHDKTNKVNVSHILKMLDTWCFGWIRTTDEY